MSTGRRLELPTRRLNGVHFSSFSSEETKQLSVKEIINPESFDSLQHPTIGGLYDPSMGPVELHELCATCHQLAIHCPGHMGHISLPLPVYHPLFFALVYQLLRVTCLCCDHLLHPGPRVQLIKCQLKLLTEGLLVKAFEVEELFSSRGINLEDDNVRTDKNRSELHFDGSVMTEFVDRAIADGDVTNTEQTAQSKNLTEARRILVDQFFKNFAQFKQCGTCGAPVRRLKKEGLGKLFVMALNAKDAQRWALAKHQYFSEEETGVKKEVEGNGAPLYQHELQLAKDMQYLSPLDVRSHLRHLFEHEGELLSKLISLSESRVGVDVFFLEAIPVPPPKFRPSNFAQGLRYDNPQTSNLSVVLKSAQELRRVLKEETIEEEQEVVHLDY